MAIEYSKIDLNVTAQYEEESKYGLHETTDNDTGTTHHTYWDEESNTRHSYDTDAEGNVSNDHYTDQNYSKGEDGRRW